ncbi:MAG: hypothetical protein H7A45_11070 [Verrucomicrobiales bacterium]|nr:hypothetical protein [Verrucomicrobiales bacterium]
MSEVTRLLDAVESGESQAADELLPLVYEELRQSAVARMANESPGQTRQPTALVQEAWICLLGPDRQPQSWRGRGHFFGAAAEAMRRILVDKARRKQRLKHGEGRQSLDLDALPEIAVNPTVWLRPRESEAVSLRCAGGLRRLHLAQAEEPRLVRCQHPDLLPIAVNRSRARAHFLPRTVDGWGCLDNELTLSQGPAQADRLLDVEDGKVAVFQVVDDDLRQGFTSFVEDIHADFLIVAHLSERGADVRHAQHALGPDRPVLRKVDSRTIPHGSFEQDLRGVRAEQDPGCDFDRIAQPGHRKHHGHRFVGFGPVIP